MMLKVYDYLYFGLYRLLLRTTDEDIAEYSAAIFLSMILVLNLFFIMVVFNLHDQVNLSPRALALLVFIPFVILNYYYFVRSERFKLLAREYKCFDKGKLKRISGLSILFAIESILLPVTYKIITS